MDPLLIITGDVIMTIAALVPGGPLVVTYSNSFSITETSPAVCQWRRNRYKITARFIARPLFACR